MVWSLARVVDSGRERHSVRGRPVFWVRVLLRDNGHEQCVTLFFADTVPSVPRRTAAIDELLEQQNKPVLRDFLEEHSDLLRERITSVIARGYTRDAIKQAIIDKLDSL